MTTGAAVWLTLAAAFSVLFFAIAAVVTYFGVRDLRQLLHGTGDQRDGADGTPD